MSVTETTPRYEWTQPCCEDCWNDRNPDRQAARIVDEYAEQEVCVYCGGPTASGIYVRIDPAEAPHPTRVK